MWNSKLPDATRQKVEGYLAHKWGLSGNLPSNHPYKIGHPLAESPLVSYLTHLLETARQST